MKIRKWDSFELVYGSRLSVNSKKPLEALNAYIDSRTGFTVPVPFPEIHALLHENMHVVYFFLRLCPGWENYVEQRFREKGLPFNPRSTRSLRRFSIRNISRYPTLSREGFRHELYTEALTEYAIARAFGYEPRPAANIIGEAAAMLCSPAAIEQSDHLTSLHHEFFRQVLVEGMHPFGQRFQSRYAKRLTRNALRDGYSEVAIRNYRPVIGPQMKQAIFCKSSMDTTAAQTTQETGRTPLLQIRPNLPHSLKAALRIAELRWPSATRRVVPFIQGNCNNEYNPSANTAVTRDQRLHIGLSVTNKSDRTHLFSPLLDGKPGHDLARRLNQALDVNWFDNDTDAREFCALYTAVSPTVSEFMSMGGYKFIDFEMQRIHATDKRLIRSNSTTRLGGLGRRHRLTGPSEAFDACVVGASMDLYRRRHTTLELPASLSFYANILDRWMGFDAPGARERQTLLQPWIESGANGPCPVALPSVAVDLIDDFRHGNLGAGWHYASQLRSPKAFRPFDLRSIAQEIGVALPPLR